MVGAKDAESDSLRTWTLERMPLSWGGVFAPIVGMSMTPWIFVTVHRTFVFRRIRAGYTNVTLVKVTTENDFVSCTQLCAIFSAPFCKLFAGMK